MLVRLSFLSLPILHGQAGQRISDISNRRHHDKYLNPHCRRKHDAQTTARNAATVPAFVFEFAPRPVADSANCTSATETTLETPPLILPHHFVTVWPTRCPLPYLRIQEPVVVTVTVTATALAFINLSSTAFEDFGAIDIRSTKQEVHLRLLNVALDILATASAPRHSRYCQQGRETADRLRLSTGPTQDPAQSLSTCAPYVYVNGVSKGLVQERAKLWRGTWGSRQELFRIWHSVLGRPANEGGLDREEIQVCCRCCILSRRLHLDGIWQDKRQWQVASTVGTARANMSRRVRSGSALDEEGMRRVVRKQA